MKAINHCHLLHNLKGKTFSGRQILNSDIEIIIQKWHWFCHVQLLTDHTKIT